VDNLNLHNEISSIQAAFNVGWALLFLVISAFFMNTHKKRYGAASLWTGLSGSYVFIFLGITTCLIVSVIQTSIALSLGLVGALSIVRFRTPIKSPEDLTKLFFSVAIGIGCASGQTLVTAIFITVVCIFDVVFRFIRVKVGRVDTNEYEIFISLNKEDNLDLVLDYVKNQSKNNYRVSRIDNREGSVNVWIHSSLNTQSLQNIKETFVSKKFSYKNFSIQAIS
jgi:uncharacterized membrane protein YhiD involved in acid resistance